VCRPDARALPIGYFVTSPADFHENIRPGELLAGKYLVERVIGQGGMGVVVLAHHIQLDEKVALKLLLPKGVENPDALGRFMREARAAAKVKGEHVARVSDVGQLENGVPYIVMEYLEGNDLAHWLQTRGALPMQQAVDFVLQVCDALANAHSVGIVHRDLKPANLFCVQRSDGELSIKVLDFGISKITTPGAPGHDMTRTTTLMGSPRYMSPEQMHMTKNVDARTDIWSLGVILFELLTGRPPFDAEAVTQLAIRIVNEPAPPLRSLRADAPAALEQVIATCLEKDRGRRYQTVGDLAVALLEFGSKHARRSVESVLGTLRKAGISGAVLPSQYPPARPAPLSGPTLPVSSGSSGQLMVTAPDTSASWGNTGGRTSSSGKVVMAIAVAVVLGVSAVAGVVVVSRLRPATSIKPVATNLPPPIEPPAVSPDLTAAAETSTPTVLAPEPTATSSATSTSPFGKPGFPPFRPVAGVRGALPPTAATPPPTAATATPPPAARPNCNPPYVIDAAGNHQYKPECL
jgi:serine/threonine-protein kinase